MHQSQYHCGLTKREYIATACLQGLLAAQIHGFTDVPSKGPFARLARDAADALLAELESNNP